MIITDYITNRGGTGMMGLWIVVGIVFFLLIALIAVFVMKYRTAGPDEALIVTGSYLGRKNVHTDEAGNKIKLFVAVGHLYYQFSNKQNR